MNNENENLNAYVEQSSNNNDNKRVVKIVVGVVIILVVLAATFYLFIYSILGNIFNTAINEMEKIEPGVVDTINDSTINGINKVQEQVNNVTTNLNSQKTSIIADKFSEIMKEKNYELTETTSLFTQYGEYVKKSYAAKTTGYQIEFYELENVEKAIDMYEYNKNIFESQKVNSSVYSTVSKNNFNVYSLSTNGQYKYLSRVDNTLLFINVSDAYEEIVKNLTKELGY